MPSDNTLDRLRVQWLMGLADSGSVDTSPVETLTQRYPLVKHVMGDLKLLMECAVADDAVILPAVAQSHDETEGDQEASPSSGPVQTVVYFRCTLRPETSDPLRAALIDLQLLALGQVATQVAITLAYYVRDNGSQLRLNSVRLDDRGGVPIIHATRTVFRQEWGVSWNFESRFFDPYPDLYPDGEPGLWTHAVFRLEERLLPSMFLGKPSLDPGDRIEDQPGGPEYLRVNAILRAVNETVRVFLSDIVDRPAARLPYGYRAVDRVSIKDTLATRFDKEELCDLAFNLDVACDDLKGSTLRAQALALVEYCEHRDLLLKLAKQVLRERPDAEVWAT